MPAGVNDLFQKTKLKCDVKLSRLRHFQLGMWFKNAFGACERKYAIRATKATSRRTAQCGGGLTGVFLNESAEVGG